MILLFPSIEDEAENQKIAYFDFVYIQGNSGYHGYFLMDINSGEVSTNGDNEIINERMETW